MSVFEDVWEILEPHLLPIAILAAAALVGLVIANITNAILRRTAAGNESDLFHTIAHRIRGPIRLFVPLLGVIVTLPLLDLPNPTQTFVDHAFKILMILNVSWFAIRILAAGEATLLAQYPLKVEDNLKARKFHTQIRLLRRLVVPITYFIEQPFQNWTRRSAELIGSVYLYTDYTVPVPELRALMSAGSSPVLWDLRCEIREKLLDYLQREHPEALPRTRAKLLRDAP